ncbi:MAG: GeoRSP system PqqD family peptide chaperone [Nitrospirae bacterium]|nr:GeoRSP system PqqD family peptide chaperone [Nitrospirota bacterium]
MMKIFRNPDVMWREEDEYKKQALDALEKDDEAADIGTSILYYDGRMLTLNILGTEVWKRCDGRTLDEMVSELIEVFDVSPQVLLKDAAAFLDEMKEKGLISCED